MDLTRLIGEIEAAFVAYSAGRAVVPPVGYLALPAPGDVHLKYGYIDGDRHAVVKVATGVPENARRGLPSGTALLLVFSLDTGALEAVLLDDGYLTDLRTAVAGAVAAKYLAPSPVERIGIVGTGVQARLQLELLAQVTDCRDVLVTAVNPAASSAERRERVARYCEAMAVLGFRVEPASDAHTVARACNLIVTATASRVALIDVADVRPGTHITAVGADAPGKQELDPALVVRADVVVADSLTQCLDHGELAHPAQAGTLNQSRLVELGAVIMKVVPGRTHHEQITIADLTGVAVQDIATAVHVLDRAAATAGLGTTPKT